MLRCQGVKKAPPRASQPRPRRGRFPARDAEDKREYAGLCRNCEEREVCLYTKPESVVLFCEEYR